MTEHKKSDEIRELLVELAYDEVDPLDAEAARNSLDDESLEMLEAFRSVRADLQAFDELEPAPSRVAFVAMTPPRPAAGLSRWVKGLAIAASFVVGFLLTAAIANIRVANNPDGWSISSSLWPSTPAGQSTAQPQAILAQQPAGPTSQSGLSVTPVGMSNAELDRWFENKVRAHGLTAGNTAAPAVPSSEILDRLWQVRERQLREQLRTEWDSELAGMFQTFDAQRNNDQLFIANEFGLWQENTGIELERINQVINFLLTRVPADQQVPEPRR